MSFTKQHSQILYETAYASIQHGLLHSQPLSVDSHNYPPELQVFQASFVTLKRHHNLRGCMGTVTPLRPLIDDVALHAYTAAFADPRFPPLKTTELDHLDITLSILSFPESLHFQTEEELIQQLRPKVDGIILREGKNHSTFLPSVWESLPEPREFLRHLKQKAGLPPHYWSATLSIQRYTTEFISAP